MTYCIVHKVDRLARKHLDDVEIHRALTEGGVTLVSATESIDETHSGMLLHVIMSTIAEFYPRNLATEVSKGLTQKVSTGGTPMRARIRYLNVRKRDEQGRAYRAVEVDPERVPFIQWVFEQYATGEHTVIDLFQDATARGLATEATPQLPSGPVRSSTFFKLLRNPYYISLVLYKGATHPGTHEPLIDMGTWQRAQTLLDNAKSARVRKRTYDHYLKGSLFCGTRGSRMQLDLPKNKQGVRYVYVSCTGRHKRTTDCTRRAVPVTVAERLVADCYSRISINPTQYADLARQVEAAFAERFAARSVELAELTANRRRLKAESDKIFAARFAAAIDLGTLKRHQDRIRTGMADIDRRLAAEHDQDQRPRKQITRALRLLVDCQKVYRGTDAQGKRLANQTFTNGIEIDEDEDTATLRLAEPFTVASSHRTPVRHVITSEMVDLRGADLSKRKRSFREIRVDSPKIRKAPQSGAFHWWI